MALIRHEAPKSISDFLSQAKVLSLWFVR